MVGWTDARDLRTSSTNGMNSNTIKRGFSFRFLERSKEEKANKDLRREGGRWRKRRGVWRRRRGGWTRRRGVWRGK